MYVAIVLWRPLLAPLASRRLSLPSSSLRGFSQKSIELLWRGACTCRNQGKRPHTYHGKSVSAVMLPRLLPGSHRLSSRRPLTKPVSDSLLSVCPISPYICELQPGVIGNIQCHVENMIMPQIKPRSVGLPGVEQQPCFQRLTRGIHRYK